MTAERAHSYFYLATSTPTSLVFFFDGDGDVEYPKYIRLVKRQAT